MNKNNRKALLLYSTSAFIFSLIFSSGCTPASTKDLGIPASEVSFTMTPVAGRVNTYLLSANATNAFSWQWDKANGAGFKNGKQTDTAYFALKGNYTVRLRAFGRGGYDTAAQSVTITVDDIVNNPNFKLLTAKSWKLNPADGANAIIVGTDANPAQYFGGGALADCQKDDVYTFTTGLKLNYASNGATFNGGNIAPNFNCGSDRSYSDVPFTFTLGGESGAIATITIPGAVPDQFIGVTDISSNTYRIMSISANAMVLRSGTAAQTVHQFKFVAQ
jgi:PKD repeat protein